METGIINDALLLYAHCELCEWRMKILAVIFIVNVASFFYRNEYKKQHRMLVLANKKNCIFFFCASKIWSFNQTSFFTGEIPNGAQNTIWKKERYKIQVFSLISTKFVKKQKSVWKENKLSCAKSTRLSPRSMRYFALFDSKTTEQGFLFISNEKLLYLCDIKSHILKDPFSILLVLCQQTS